jgi:hypothetical protein
MNRSGTLRLCGWMLSAFVTTLSQVSASSAPAVLTVRAGHVQVRHAASGYTRDDAAQRGLPSSV